MTDDITEITCIHCGETKPVDEFSIDRCKKRTGRRANCKVCERATNQARRDNRSNPWELLMVAITFQREDWMDDAACRGKGPTIFFPHRGGDSERAKAICRNCPVQFRCLEYSMRTNEKHGIWGGTAENGRRDLRRRRKQGAAA